MTRYYEAHRGKSATILEFPRPKARGRGRPRSNKPKTDTGTPELVMKRAYGETQETLDLMLERRLITQQQHWCGIHLRWLYTLRFGAPSVKTIDLTHDSGFEIKPEDPQWRAAREAEYNEAISHLSAGNHVNLLLGICVHNERPRYLHHKNATKRTADELTALTSALDILSHLWRK